MKLKHDCPAPSKYSSDELLWKTASVNFLKAVRDCVPSLKKFGSSTPFLALERDGVDI